MHLDSIMFDRFCRESAGMLPPDTRGWATAALAAHLPPAERFVARNALVRQAGALVGGTAWARARVLRGVISARLRPAGDPVADLVREAEAIARVPSSIKQLLRILKAD